MPPWIECPTINIDFCAPLQQRFSAAPPQAYARARELLDGVLREMPPLARSLAELVGPLTGGRFDEECQALARAVNVDWRDVMLANVSYDFALAYLGCSTVALATPHGPVVARNMDWWPEDLLARASYQLRFSEQGRLRFINAGWPGAIGAVTGVSASGFCVVLNAVLSPDGVEPQGYPVLLFVRSVLEDALDFEDALARLTHERLAAPGLFTLAGRENSQRVVIERTPIRHALRWAVGNDPLIATNDYRRLFRPQTSDVGEIYRTTCDRYAALERHLQGYRGDRIADDAELLNALTAPDVIQGITAQHVVLRPRDGNAKLFAPRRFFLEPA